LMIEKDHLEENLKLFAKFFKSPSNEAFYA